MKWHIKIIISLNFFTFQWKKGHNLVEMYVRVVKLAGVLSKDSYAMHIYTVSLQFNFYVSEKKS